MEFIIDNKKPEQQKYKIEILGNKLSLSVTVSDIEDLELVKKFIKEFIVKKLSETKTQTPTSEKEV